MSTTTRLAGAALIAAGAALSVVSFRLADRDAVRERAQAESVAVAASAQERQAHDAEELRAIERSVRRAAALEPLAAAVKLNVDSATLVDLFESEDWWRPYRTDFTFARLIVDGGVLATRASGEVGALGEVGTLDKPVVKLARRQGVASGVVELGGHPYLLAAARLPVLADRAPILVLGRAPVPAPAAPRAASAAATPVHPLPFVLAAVVMLAGVAVLVFDRRGRRRGDRSAPAVEEAGAPLARFSAPGGPRWQTDGGGSAASALTETAVTAVPRHEGASPVAMVGRYRLLARLGEGGMAELFVAEVTGVEGFSRTFVLKRLRPELANEQDAVAQFVEEARLQASLVHSNIVPVFDFGMAGSQYFMTQEYIVGRDLARLMTRHQERGGRELPADIAYFVAHEVLQALAYAHDTRDKTGATLGVVHRDVSAGNVMVSFQGEVKLSDFGIVKSNRRVSRTQSGTVKGNANFMSPEQARGHAVDGRCDLFSLGLLFYYCLTGEMLYWGDNDLEVLYRAANGPTVEDLDAIGALPEPAASIVRRALAPEPEGRFQTATEFAEALAPHLGGGKHATIRLMQRLFAEEIQRQTA